MIEEAEVGGDGFERAVALGEGAEGGASVFLKARTGEDGAGEDFGAEKWDAVRGELFILFIGVEGEAERGDEIGDDREVAEELRLFIKRDNDEEVVNIAAVMLVAESEGDEAVELVEVDVGEELAGEVADDDALAGRLGEEAFFDGKFGPSASFTTKSGV